MVTPPRGQIEGLLAKLASQRAAERDSAVARLTLLGERAVDPLISLLKGAPTSVMCQALTVLGQIRAQRSLPAISELAAHSDPLVAARAIEALGAFEQSVGALSRLLRTAPAALRPTVVESLRQLLEAGSVAAVDALGDLLRDDRAEDEVRLSALEGLATLPARDLLPLLKRLPAGTNAAVAARARLLIATCEDPALGRLLKRLERVSPSDEERLLSELGRLGSLAAEALALRLGDRDLRPEHFLRIGRALTRIRPEDGIAAVCRALERTTAPLCARVLVDTLADWRAPQAVLTLHATLKRASDGGFGRSPDASAELRARTHLALGACGSAIALYDLREMLRKRPPIAVATLLRAAALIDDGALLPDIVALAHDDPEDFDLCAAAFAQISERGATRRNSRALKGISSAQQPTLERLWRARRAAPSATRVRRG